MGAAGYELFSTSEGGQSQTKNETISFAFFIIKVQI
jgi:hypothetical protein